MICRIFFLMCGNQFLDVTASYLEIFSNIKLFGCSAFINLSNKYLWSTYSVQNIILSGLLRQTWHRPCLQGVYNLVEEGEALLLTTVQCKQAMCNVRGTD